MKEENQKRSWTTAVRFGIGLGIVVAIYGTVLTIGDLYTNNVLELWVTLGIEWSAIVWFLVKGAKAGNGFLRQLGEGTLLVLVLAAVLVPPTWIQLTVIAPDYADVILEKAQADAEARGVPPERVEKMIERLRPMYTPVRQTSFLFVGTLMTCLPVVLLVSAFVRRRGVGASRPGAVGESHGEESLPG